MARRVTWTNNSTSYDGTNIYRDTTIDPQNLPEPIATIDPVAQGATVEYVDLTGSGDQCYAVRDFDSSGDGVLSDAYCFEEPIDPPGVGEYWTGQGGYYAGIITYGDATEYYLIVAEAASQDILAAKTENTQTAGTQNDYDGKSNTDAMETAGLSLHPAANLCVGYTKDNQDDFYLGAKEEWLFLHAQLSASNAPTAEFQSGGSQEFDAEYYWTSTENSSTVEQNIVVRMSDAFVANVFKTNTRRIRPVRRIPV